MRAVVVGGRGWRTAVSCEQDNPAVVRPADWRGRTGYRTTNPPGNDG